MSRAIGLNPGDTASPEQRLQAKLHELDRRAAAIERGAGAFDILRPVNATLRLQGGPSAAGTVEVSDRLSVSNAHSFGAFPDPGAGGVYAYGNIQSRENLTVSGTSQASGSTNAIGLFSGSSNSIILTLGSSVSLVGSAVSTYNGGIRMLGIGVAHGDFGYYPNGGLSGEFRFSRGPGSWSTAADAVVSAGQFRGNSYIVGWNGIATNNRSTSSITTYLGRWALYDTSGNFVGYVPYYTGP